MDKIAVVGLGYVGLPLAVAFGNKHETVGFDINVSRVDELKRGHDRTLEVDDKTLKAATKLSYATDLNGIRDCNWFIVTVPTPIDKSNRPDLTPLLRASETVGKVLKKGDIVVYESTVYPGATEEDCVPILERESGLKYNADFFCGYSPERINPGDKEHTVTKILKVTSGSNEETAEKVDQLYKSVITAGTHKASSIKVAEAAKVIENSQRDINIGFVNELALIFNRMGIDTLEVLEASGTKWNFLPFKPGLVGGHCIGVDPYYLTHKAEVLGYHPEIILSGRRLNDRMGSYVAGQTVKLMIKKGHRIKGSKVLCLGITFKENCPDIRNSRAIDVVREFQEFGCAVSVADPWADSDEVKREYGLDMISADGIMDRVGEFEAVVLVVAHDKFRKMSLPESADMVVFDVKGVWDKNMVDERL